MEREYVILYIGCNEDKYPIRIDLDTKVMDNWSESKIMEKLNIDPKTVSQVLVGPKTVFEHYIQPFFTGDKNRVINQSPSDVRLYTFGCFHNHEIWRGGLRSFKLWSFDYFMSVNGNRYCDNDRQCRDNEMCLCPSGNQHPSHCPKTKRRCMHSSYFTTEGPIRINDTDFVDQICFQNELKTNDSKINFGLIQGAARKCIRNKPIEGFSQINQMGIVLIIIVCIIFIMCFRT